MLEHDAPAATLLGEAMRGHAERVVDHLYKRVIEAFGVLFVGVLLIVVTATSWGCGKRSTRGCTCLRSTCLTTRATMC